LATLALVQASHSATSQRVTGPLGRNKARAAAASRSPSRAACSCRRCLVDMRVRRSRSGGSPGGRSPIRGLWPSDRSRLRC